MATGYDYLHQGTIDSLLITARDCESFFSPVSLLHTGYAHDGIWYDAGVQNNLNLASWLTEPVSATRGSSPWFPSPCIVLLSLASLSILLETDSSLPLWMLFFMGDGLALTSSFGVNLASYTPSGLSWANGLLSATFSPDAGSTDPSSYLLTIDFTRDRAYLETTQ